MTLLTLVVGGWVMGLGVDQVNLLSRSILIAWLGWQTGFALLTRLILRWLTRMSTRPLWQLIAAPEYQLEVLREWQRNPFVRPPRLLTPNTFESEALELRAVGKRSGLALPHELHCDPSFSGALDDLRSRGVMVMTVEELAQRQLERLPSKLLPLSWLSIDDLP